MKILVTSNSFMSIDGSHKAKLKEHEIIFKSGPLPEKILLDVISANKDIGGIICGDDEFTEKVLHLLRSIGIKKISKYGVGLDKIDLLKAMELDIEVLNCAGVNSSTVAEHTLSLLLFWAKNYEHNVLNQGYKEWNRGISRDINGLTVGILGLGNIGREVASVYRKMGLIVRYYDPFVESHDFERVENLHALSDCEIISIHVPLTNSTRGLIDEFYLDSTKNSVIINTSRAEVINEIALKDWLTRKNENRLLTDVLYEEPPKADNWMLQNSKILITPHVGSRSVECIIRQANMTVDNLLK